MNLVCDLFTSNNQPIALHFLVFVSMLFCFILSQRAIFRRNYLCVHHSFDLKYKMKVSQIRQWNQRYATTNIYLFLLHLSMCVLPIFFFCHGLVTSSMRMTHWHTFIASQICVYFNRYFRMVNQKVWLILHWPEPLFRIVSIGQLEFSITHWKFHTCSKAKWMNKKKIIDHHL